MSIPHKEYALPDVDLSHDEGDPRWHAAGGMMSTPSYDSAGQVTHYTWNGLHPGHYQEYWQLCVASPWEEAVRAYEKHPEDILCAWTYTDAHPAFWRFTLACRADYPLNHVSRLVHAGALTRGWPEVTPHRVCPETGRQEEEDRALNTQVTWWYELGPEKLLPGATGSCPWHDPSLDGSAGTYEEAIIALARAIHDSYGNDRQVIDSGAWRNAG